MFGSESCLHGLYKLAHGTRNIAEQIAYWYTIHRSVHSMSIQHQANGIIRDYLMDGYIDESIIQKYNQQFENLFYLKFSFSSDKSILFRSRYKKELIVYHSISYSFRKRSSSFNVCVTNSDCSKKSVLAKLSSFSHSKVNLSSFFLFIHVHNLIYFLLLFP
jgi:hypothetical protein